MNRRGVGAVFCMIASFLVAVHYLSAAIFMSNVQSWNSNLFATGLGYVGYELDILAAVFLIIGIGYLVKAELDNKKN